MLPKRHKRSHIFTDISTYKTAQSWSISFTHLHRRIFENQYRILSQKFLKAFLKLSENIFYRCSISLRKKWQDVKRAINSYYLKCMFTSPSPSVSNCSKATALSVLPNSRSLSSSPKSEDWKRGEMMNVSCLAFSFSRAEIQFVLLLFIRWKLHGSKCPLINGENKHAEVAQKACIYWTMVDINLARFRYICILLLTKSDNIYRSL